MSAPGFRGALRAQRTRHEAVQAVITLISDAGSLFPLKRLWIEQDDRLSSGRLYFTVRGMNAYERRFAGESAERLVRRANAIRAPVPFEVYFVRRGLIGAAHATRALLDMGPSGPPVTWAVVRPWAEWLAAHTELVCRWEPR